MEIISRIFERSKLNQELVSLSKYNDDDRFWCGYVVEYNDTLVKLRHFSRFGKPDGEVVFLLDKIKNIDFDNNYLRLMQRLVKNPDILDNESTISFNLTDGESWDYDVLTQLVGNKEVLTSVEISGSEIETGFIVEVAEDDFVMQLIGSNGEDEGLSIFSVIDVTSVDVNDLDNRRRLLFYKWRQDQL